MEKLFAYALLCSEGFDVWNQYADTLDMLFMADPENDTCLSLEGMKPREAVLHSISVMQGSEFDAECFGKALMASLQGIYQKTPLPVFAGKMYSLWNKLPSRIDQDEPFFTLCYADDCLSYGDERQCRELYEKAIHYYDKTGG